MSKKKRVSRMVKPIHLIILAVGIIGLVISSITYTNSVTYPALVEEVLGVTGRAYYISPTGSDSNDGLSPQKPWASLDKANSAALEPGDGLIFERGGTWTGRLTISRSGNSTQNVYVGAYGTGNAPTFRNPGGTWNHAVELRGDYITVQDIKIIDTLEACLSLEIGADYNTVKHVEAEHCGQAILVRGTHNLLTGNYLHDGVMVVNTQGGDDDFGSNGIVIRSSDNEASYNRITNCRVPSYDYGFDGGAFELYSTQSTPSNLDNNYLHHNYVEGCDGFLEVGGKNPKTAKNNILAHNISYNNKKFGGIHNGTGTGGFSVDVQNLLIENNTIVETEPDAKHIFWIWSPATAATINFKNNIVVSGVKFGDSNQVGKISHSNNLLNMLNGAKNPLSGEKSGDPLFANINSRDFSLKSGSPAVGLGANLSYAQTGLGGNPPAQAPTPTPTATATPAPTTTPTPTPTTTPSPSPTPTITPSSTPSSTPHPSWTPRPDNDQPHISPSPTPRKFIPYHFGDRSSYERRLKWMEYWRSWWKRWWENRWHNR